MTNLFFFLACAAVAGIPAFVWIALFVEFFDLPALGWIGGVLIFWLFMIYMVSGNKHKKDVQDWYERD